MIRDRPFQIEVEGDTVRAEITPPHHPTICIREKEDPKLPP